MSRFSHRNKSSTAAVTSHIRSLRFTYWIKYARYYWKVAISLQVRASGARSATKVLNGPISTHATTGIRYDSSHVTIMLLPSLRSLYTQMTSIITVQCSICCQKRIKDHYFSLSPYSACCTRTVFVIFHKPMHTGMTEHFSSDDDNNCNDDNNVICSRLCTQFCTAAAASWG